MKPFQRLQSLLDRVPCASDLKHAHENSVTEKLGSEKGKKINPAAKSKLLRKTLGVTEREEKKWKNALLLVAAFQKMSLGHVPQIQYIAR